MTRKRGALAVGALIGMCFLLTGSEYITWWLYKLPTVFSGVAVDALSEGAGYLFQALGMALFSAFVKRKAQVALSGACFRTVILADAAMTALAYHSTGAFGILVFGFLMNLLHGASFAYYLTRMAQILPQQRMGIVFGLAYAFGSVGSWALSLPMNGAFLGSSFALIVYGVLAVIILAIDRAMPDAPAEREDKTERPCLQPSTVFLAAVVIVLLSAVKGLGFFFPSANHLDGDISAVFMRVFYALGLIAAGIVNDRDRKAGAICCVAALVFPFVAFGLNDKPSAAVVLWIAGYVFFGFFSVYRVVTFADIAGKRGSYLFLAGFGLLFGRVGDAAGAIGGIALRNSFSALLAVTAALFIVTILLFFKYYNRLYAAPLPREESAEALLFGFRSRYGLSAREAEVFRLVADGRSNSEIAADLFIAESTVKFHVRNILKKAACANRAELLAAFRSPSL